MLRMHAELQLKLDSFDAKYKELLEVQAECFDGDAPSELGPLWTFPISFLHVNVYCETLWCPSLKKSIFGGMAIACQIRSLKTKVRTIMIALQKADVAMTNCQMRARLADNFT